MNWLRKNAVHVAYAVTVVCLLGEIKYLQQFKPEADPYAGLVKSTIEFLKPPENPLFVIRLPF
jgi:hypothetical protein